MLSPWLTPFYATSSRARRGCLTRCCCSASRASASSVWASRSHAPCSAKRAQPCGAPGGCGECAACLWFDQGNHPDYRLVTTEERALAAGLDDAEDNAAEGDAPAGKKAPSREIRFQQLAALKSFLSVATHRGGYRIVLVHPAETMNATAANMLLKVLEEPPDRTVFLLVSDRIDALPATIVSRCRKLPVPTPSREVAVAWLREQGSPTPTCCSHRPAARRMSRSRWPVTRRWSRRVVASSSISSDPIRKRRWHWPKASRARRSRRS